MPIKDRSIYPPYWKQFSEWVRFERAKNRCEQCQAPNGETIARGIYIDDFSEIKIWIDAEGWARRMSGVDLGYIRNDQWEFRYNATIVLTVAHLDQEGGSCDCKARTGRKCARPDHVKALCQACHLTLDMPKHIANRLETTSRRKDAERGLLANQ